MIRDVPLTAIFVDDQEAALAFHTHKLGLEKIQDEPYGEGWRWITVSHGRHEVLEGQGHVVPPEILVPVLAEFFGT